MATYDVIVKNGTITGHIPKKLLFKRWLKFHEFLVNTKIMKIKTPQSFNVYGICIQETTPTN